MLKDGTERTSVTRDLAAFTDYLKKHSTPEEPIRPPKADRITWR
ncbi:hypothetical protein SAMN05421870_10639 [Streptomyces qinglanensis]|uniref:Uncharacterized protein n=1 Tax=Streptomyces qinglanensis TaxID=943816 RepID=A0A1H9TE19_9ACTN|nr:hypothetical protein SAMN05421870_10639 [Streptomyces qinglanensis]